MLQNESLLEQSVPIQPKRQEGQHFGKVFPIESSPLLRDLQELRVHRALRRRGLLRLPLAVSGRDYVFLTPSWNGIIF